MSYERAKVVRTHEQIDHQLSKQAKGSTRIVAILACAIVCLLLAICIVISKESHNRQDGVTSSKEIAAMSTPSKLESRQKRIQRESTTRRRKSESQRTASKRRSHKRKTVLPGLHAKAYHDTSSISGTVHDQANKPVPESKLRLFRIEKISRYQAPRKEKLKTTTSVADGSYHFRNLPPGEYGILAEHKRFAPTFRSGIVLLKGLSRSDIVIVLHRGGTISGIVVDEDGKPITTARLRIGDIFTSVGNSGRFVFRRVPRGLRHIDAFAKQYEPTRSEALYVEPNRVIRNVRIVMKPGASISGIVVDEKNRPVARARVKIDYYMKAFTLITYYRPQNQDYAGSDRWHEVRTRPDGSFRFDSLKGDATYGLLARARGYAPNSAKVQSNDENVRIVLKRGGGISGRVTRLDNGNPVAGATVTCTYGWSNMGYSESRYASTHTNEDGSYTFGDLRPGKYYVSVEAEKLVARAKGDVKVEVGKVTKGIDFAVYPGMKISGRVIDAATQAPIAGAIVNCEIQSYFAPERKRSDSVLADREGKFTLENLAEGTYMVYAEAEGYARMGRSDLIEFKGNRKKPLHGPWVTLEQLRDVSGVVVKLFPGGVVQGKVKGPSKRGIADVKVQLGSGVDERSSWQRWALETMSDAEGNFEFTGVPFDVKVSAAVISHPGFVYSASKSFILTPEQPDHWLDLTVKVGGTILGTVTNTLGEPVEGASISVDYLSYKYTRTRSDGSYRIEHLYGGPHKIFASASGYRASSKADVRVEEAGETVVNFTLEAGELTISGRTIDDRGNPIEDVYVAAYDGKGWYSRTTSDREGRYKLDVLSSRKYAIFATRQVGKKYHTQRVELEDIPAGRQDVDIVFPHELKPRGALSGIVLDALTGQPIPKFTILGENVEDKWARWISFKKRQSNDGKFYIENVDEGPYRLLIMSDGYRTMDYSPVAVAAGKVTDGVVIELTKGATVTGILRSREDDKPLQFADVALMQGHIGENMFTSVAFAVSSARADSTGRFTLKGVSPGIHRLLVDSKKIMEVTINAEETLDLGVIYVSLSSGSLLITVRNAEGQLIRGMMPYVRDINNTTYAVERDDGRYALENLLSGRWLIHVGKKPEIIEPITVMPGETAEVDITMPGGTARIFGRVVNGQTPLSNLEVVLFSQGLEVEGGYRFEVKGDKNGNYEIDNIPEGEYIFYSAGYSDKSNWRRPDVVRAFPLTIAEGEVEQVDVDAPGGTLSGQVFRAGTGEPASNAQIVVQLKLDPRDMPELRGKDYPELYAIADAQGYFRLNNLQDGTWLLHAVKVGIGRSMTQEIEIRHGANVKDVKVYLK